MKRIPYRFSINSHPPFFLVCLFAIQNIAKFGLLVILAVVLAHKMGLSQSELINFIDITMLGSAISTILLALRKPVGAACFIPSLTSVSYFACLLSIAPQGLSNLLGTGIIIGAAQLLGSFILYYFNRYFTLALSGLIFFGLGIWSSALGISELFHPVGLGQIILHGAMHNSRLQLAPSLLGILILIIMLSFILIKRLRCVSILIGIMVGWIIGAFLHFIPTDHVELFYQSPWFAFPHFFHAITFNFTFRQIIIMILLGFFSSMIMYALISIVRKENYKDWEVDNAIYCTKGNLAAGLGALITSFLGGCPSSPPHGAVADLIATNTFTRSIAYVYSFILLIFTFVPKFSLFFITMPATVNGATILLMGGIMCAKGISYINFDKLTTAQLKAYSYAILLLVITDVTPHLYDIKFFSYFIPNGLVTGLVILGILMLLFSLKKYEKRTESTS